MKTMTLTTIQMVFGRTNALYSLLYYSNLLENRKNNNEMKKLYTLLLMVFAIPMSSMAQTTHLFPTLTIKLVKDGVETTDNYYLPAWDALTEDGNVRVQATSDPVEDPIPEGGGWDAGGGGAPGGGIIINGAPSLSKIRRAPRHADGKIVAGHLALHKTSGNLPLGSVWTSTINIYYGDETAPRKTAENLEAWNLTYGDILTTEEMPDEKMRAERLFIEVNEHNITGDYIIPETANDSKFAEEGNVTTYNIKSIGEAAFYNIAPKQLDQYTPDANGIRHHPFMRATSLTIPAHITSLGKRCFYGAPLLAKVSIADDSSIKTIPRHCFARNNSLREINIPASVTKIEGLAFGNCALGKIQFDMQRSTPPTLDGSPFGNAMTSEPPTDTKLCAVWVKDIETVKAFRSKSTTWNGFSFCVPFELKKEIVTYCSDLLLSPKRLELGSGMMNETGGKKNNNPNKWVVDTDANSLKLYYVATDKPQNPQTNSRTISISQMVLSAAPSGYGVLISGEPGIHPLYIRDVDAKTTEVQTLMVGTIETTPWFEETGYANYLLKDGKFYLWGSGDLAANKAYLKLPTDYFDGRTSAKELNIVFEGNDDTDGMQGVAVTESNADDAWYTLQGVRVETPHHGIFIRGGKKYVIK